MEVLGGKLFFSKRKNEHTLERTDGVGTDLRNRRRESDYNATEAAMNAQMTATMTDTATNGPPPRAGVPKLPVDEPVAPELPPVPVVPLELPVAPLPVLLPDELLIDELPPVLDELLDVAL